MSWRSPGARTRRVMVLGGCRAGGRPGPSHSSSERGPASRLPPGTARLGSRPRPGGCSPATAPSRSATWVGHRGGAETAPNAGMRGQIRSMGARGRITGAVLVALVATAATTAATSGTPAAVALGGSGGRGTRRARGKGAPAPAGAGARGTGTRSRGARRSNFPDDLRPPDDRRPWSLRIGAPTIARTDAPSPRSWSPRPGRTRRPRRPCPATGRRPGDDRARAGAAPAITARPAGRWRSRSTPRRQAPRRVDQRLRARPSPRCRACRSRSGMAATSCLEGRRDAPTGPRPLVLFPRSGTASATRATRARTGRGRARRPCWRSPASSATTTSSGCSPLQVYTTVSIRVNGINAQDYRLPDGGADARAAMVEQHSTTGPMSRPSTRSTWTAWCSSAQPRRRGGVDRASIEIPLSAPYRIVGRVPIAPTDFGDQTAPYADQTLLPSATATSATRGAKRFTDVARPRPATRR